MLPATTKIAVGIGLLLCVAAAVRADGVAGDGTVPQLTVRGDAQLSKPADRAKLSIGVVTEAEDSAEALELNSVRTQSVLDALRRIGLSEGEYQTGRFRVRPVYSPRPKQAPRSWRPQIIGYEVSNTLNVKTTQLELAGKLIQAASEAGANTIDNIRFDLEDRRKFRDEAIALAASHARSDARTLALASGVKLVRILSVNLDNVGSIQPRRYEASAMLRAAPEADMAPPIEAGDVSITSSVTVVYEIAEVE